MKKFYTLALAAAVGCTAWAAQLTPYTTTTVANRQAKPFTVTERLDLNTAATPFKAPAKAEGEITWNYLGEGAYMPSVIADFYLPDGVAATQEVVKIYEDAAKPGYYKVEGMWSTQTGAGTTVVIDATDPEYVIFPYQFTGIVDDVDGDTYVVSQTQLFTDEGFDKDLVLSVVPELVPYLKDGIIEFPAQALLARWPQAPADSKYQTDPEEYYSAGEYATAGYLLLPGAEIPEPVDPWETIDAQAQWLDNVVYSTFTETDNTEYITVEVQMSTEEEGLIRILDPLQSLYSALGIVGESPEMVIDITDPDNVMVELQETGLYSTTAGDYLYFNEGWYGAISGEAVEAGLKATLTYDETTNTSTIKFPGNSFTLYTATTQKFYYGGQAESVLIYKGQAGVKSVAADNADAPVVYYNLQGVEVANPEAGLYIRRQGTTATKVMIK